MFSTNPLKSPKDSPEVSCDENEVECVAGESDVLTSELPPSDMEDAEDSETESEVEEWDTGMNPNSAKKG